MTALAELNGARKSFPRALALDGVDLRVDRGEIVALLGPNGAGKTTAIKLLLGLRRPDEGSARLFGLDPRDPQARRRCGVTPQETDLPETLRVTEILDFVRAHFAAPVPLAQLLGRFGLEALARRQAGGLSGGERRRLAVALAFAGDPDLVFLDEPSAGLDVAARRLLWESVLGFVARGRSILLTTHDLAEAEALSTRVVVLDRGRVTVAGTTDEVRMLAGRTRIRIPRQALPPLRADAAVVENGASLTLLTRDAEALIRELVSLEADLSGLEVAPAGLEEALHPDGAP